MADPQPQPQPVAIKQMIGLAPVDAIRFLDAKGYRTSVDWTDMMHDEHVASFTAAKVAKIDILRTLHVSLLDALANGTPFAQWQAEVQPELERQGWWGKVQDASITGTDEMVTIGPRRLRVIYDTNLRMARATALWGRIQNSKGLLPFLKYSAVLDRRTRPAHRAWNGIILPVDHPWWQTHFPPCGWNCRCTVLQYSQDMLDAGGLKVTQNPPPLDPVPFYRKSTGQTLQVPRGIDPGFAYNPGQARARAIMDKAAQSLADAAAQGLADAIPSALADILAELPGGPQPRATIDRLTALAIGGEVAELAAALAELLGVTG